MRPVFCSERLRTSLLSCPACRGQGSHVWASHLCTYACTHVHTVNVLSPTNLRHPRPEDSKGIGQGGGNGIPGVFPGTGKSLWPSVWLWDALHLTSKRGDTCCILSGGPPHWGSLVIPRKLLSTSHSSLGRFQKAGVPVSRAALRLTLEMIRERKPQSTNRRSAVLVHLPSALTCWGEHRLRLAEPLSTFHQLQWEGTS